MVSSVVSSLPYFSYLDQLQGKTTATENTTTTTNTSSSDNTSSNLVSSLLGKGGFSPSTLSLLQEDGGSFDPIATILGGKSADNGLAKLYANIYNNASASALQQAKLENPKAAATSTPTFNFITDAVNASNAYNITLQQNAAYVLAQGKAQTQALIS